MDAKEARLLLRNLLIICDFIDGSGHMVDPDPFVDAAGMAMDALKKQEPVKYRCPMDTALCPCCDSVLEQQHMNGEILIHDFFTYCPNCGQKIDWGDK